VFTSTGKTKLGEKYVAKKERKQAQMCAEGCEGGHIQAFFFGGEVSNENELEKHQNPWKSWKIIKTFKTLKQLKTLKKPSNPLENKTSTPTNKKLEKPWKTLKNLEKPRMKTLKPWKNW
jgi:hypothetical protein